MNEKGNTLSHYSVFAGKICFAASFLWILSVFSPVTRNPQGYVSLLSTAFSWIFGVSWIAAISLCFASAAARASRRDVRRAFRWAFIGPVSFFVQAAFIWFVLLIVTRGSARIGLNLPW